MHSKYDIETSIGLFDIAISHASDTIQLSRTLAKFATAYGLTCYSYINMQVDQLGLDIVEVMKFVYSVTPRFIILNSQLYQASDATKLEYNTICETQKTVSVIVLEMGGRELLFPSRCNVRYVENPGNIEIIQVMKHWKETLCDGR